MLNLNICGGIKMKKIIKLGLSLVICTLFFAAAINVNGTTFKNSESKSIIINEKTISIPDSTVLLKLWDEKLKNGDLLPFYSISLDGGKTVARTVQPSYELGFRYAHFDPLINTPDTPTILNAGNDIHLFIVQFVTQPLEEFNNAITSLGGNVRKYVAQYAYVVEMTQSVRLQVESLPYVRWVGPYQPAYRLEEFMLQNLDNAYQMYPLQHYNLQVYTVEQKQIVANKITAIGGIVEKADAGKYLIEATLTPEQLFNVVRWDEINFVDRWSSLEPDMDIAREIGGANYIEEIAGYNGSGVRGEVFDAGFNLNHVDFQSRPLILHGNVGSDTHGAATSGICFGDGTGDPKGRGLLPAGQGIVGDYNYIGLEGPSRYTHTGEEVQAPYNCVFETASVGSTQTGQYTTISADTDDALFDFDIIHCQSMSNYQNNQTVRPQAWAKNIVSVGGVYHYDTLTKSDDMWNNGASVGPASDGRIKPDLWHFYDMIWTTYSSSTTGYGNFGGTSGATPITAGHFGLFFQMWSDGIFGNDVTPGGTVFENRPHMTTAKAMMINTADQYPFNGTTNDKTRTHQGWGMASVKNLYDLKDDFYIIDETDILEPFEVSTHIVSVEAGSPYLKITMTYADPAGNPAVQTQHRINDLTLKVTSPSNVVYWGDNGLLEGLWSTPGGDPNTKDTVENVFIENPEQGAWTVEVSADEIIQDSHVETPEMDADYALVASPVLKGPNPPVITGPTEVDIGKDYDFSFVTDDPLGENLYYWIEWGDGNVEEWLGPYTSGQEITVSHAWFTKGNFSITAKAKNALGNEGGWSIPCIITVLAPDIEIEMITGGFFRANVAIKNKGGADATNISWNLTVSGNAVFLGKETNGVIESLSAGEVVKVKSNIIIGLGKTQFIANSIEPYGSWDIRQQGGKLFLFYVMVNIGG
jgi:serine protease AprX